MTNTTAPAAHRPVVVKFRGASCCAARAMGDQYCTCSASCAECVEAANRWAFGLGGNASYRMDNQRQRHAAKCAANAS